MTYIRNVVPWLADANDVRVTVALSPGLASEFQKFSNISLVEMQVSAPRRFWYEQSALPEAIRRSGADILLSTGNFAVRRSPVPQILLSRNSIYTSGAFYRDLLVRHEYRMWLETHAQAFLAKRSMSWAEVTVAPSEAFAAGLRHWIGPRIAAKVRTIHHGFDPKAFTHDETPLAAEVEEKLRKTEGSLRLLFVSHYNYYRNFETLLRALPLLRNRLANRQLRLLLTCRLAAGKNPGAYRAKSAARLVQDLGVSDLVVELGGVPYHHLHQVYRRADLYVTPAYTETFAHPLVEAMSCGLPVVASDLPVHREICGGSAIYFPRFSPQSLAGCVEKLACSPESAASMARLGLERSRGFSWKTHVDELMRLSRELVNGKPDKA
ncbi:MAG TPA: glycosyltransferase family 1 protein [Verrucomicrobiae bacterium]|nr:glycosyltransferase family 1 protein [Verrucomicrobiae bacterium]